MTVVRRIWKVLGFEAKPLPTIVDSAIFTNGTGADKIPRVKLHTRLIGNDLHYPAAARFTDFCRDTHLWIELLFYYIVSASPKTSKHLVFG